MSKKDKLIKKILSRPKDFTFAEAETLLELLGYTLDDKGKTSGSRVKFSNNVTKDKIYLHRPHPRKELLDYQVNELIKHLYDEGAI
ncbi:MAG: type II toxin-antitoxin system HicA family toxin [Lachnospiraceae bacterium]|nr:type II toxin-antitoxin system HicA family toxin [Lachnospiraceae bacterium]